MLRRYLAIICLLLPVSMQGWAFEQQDDELLPPERAFALSGSASADALAITYDIAEGYYLYRSRFEFVIDEADQVTNFGDARIPDGKKKIDEFFGEVEVYRNQLPIQLPLIYETYPAQQLRLIVTSQGCADMGVCYPPQKQVLEFDMNSPARVMPVAYDPQQTVQETAEVAELKGLLAEIAGNLEQQKAESQAAADPIASEDNPFASLGLLGDGGGFGNDGDDIPHPDDAFLLTAKLDANNVIQAHFLLADKVYMYREQFKIDMAGGSGHSVGAMTLPSGIKKNDEFLGPIEAIYGEAWVPIPIITGNGASNDFSVSIEYQGCLEDRICYPPITKYLNVDAGNGLIEVANQPSTSNALAQIVGGTTAPATSVQIPASTDNVEAPLSAQEEFAQMLMSESLLWIIGIFFLAGLGLTFTPCVFPMIPILSSIIAGQGEDITTRKAFTLSLVYVLPMALTYAIIGAIAGYYGAEFNLQIWFQDPVVLGVFAAIFALLALSMFGFYDLQLPNALQSRLTAISNNQAGGTYIGAGIMGFLSAIIVGPCVTAPLIGALIFITQTQDWLLGGLALFALGLGMGTPLLVIGTSAGHLLPRAGAWMENVKKVFGVVLLGVAVWLLERVLPVEVTMLLVAILLIGSAVYMGALQPLPETASGWSKLNKTLAVVILVTGGAYLLGVYSGSKDLLQPLKIGNVASVSGPAGSGVASNKLQFIPIKGKQGLQLSLQDAGASGQTVMLDFYADWCVSCKEMERYTFSDSRVITALSDSRLLKTDVTANDDIDVELMSSLGIYGPPAILFFDKNGNELRNRRVVGFMEADDFVNHINTTF